MTQPGEALREAATELLVVLDDTYPEGETHLSIPEAIVALRAALAAPVAGEGLPINVDFAAQRLRHFLTHAVVTTDEKRAFLLAEVDTLERAARALLAAPVAGEGLDVERRSTDAAFGALGAVGDDLQKCIERSEVYRTGLAETVVRANTAEMHRDRAWQNLDLAHEDIAAMLRASGLGDHARPISTHDVIQNELLPWIVRAALAAPVAGEGLDVERLARAIHTAQCVELEPHHGISSASDDRLAEKVAREYAALAAPVAVEGLRQQWEANLLAVAANIKAEHDLNGHREPCAICAAASQPVAEEGT